MNTKNRVSVLLFMGALWATAASARSSEVLIQPIASSFPSITLSVNVRDEAGHPITGLTAADFTVTEDLEKVKITDFKAIDVGSHGNNKVDIVFVFDDTGSMSEEIEGLKEKTIEFANILQTSGVDYNLGLVSYKDSVDNPYRSTADVAQFKSWVSALTASGGGDEPENTLDAIESAAGQPFRPGAKVIFVVITDASFHASDSVTARTMQGVVNDLDAKAIQLHVVGPNIDQYKVMTSDLGGTFYDKDSGQFKRIIAQIAGGSAGNYKLTYTSSRPQNDFTWRAVELAVNGPEARNGVTQYQAPSWVTASSRRDPLEGGESRYSPHFVVDGDSGTAWSEGVQGAGKGEWIALNFDSAVKVDSFTIEGGSRDVALPTKIAIQINEGDKRYYDIDKGSKSFTGTFDTTQDVKRFKVTIEDASGSNVGFSEIVLSGGKPAKIVAPIAVAREARLAGKVALDINKKGEVLYHQKKYDEAIYYYKQAIEKDPTYAQAFSNLGLAYQRINDYSNAIWANRKAIALARGGSRAVVMASSYYNIARIFEAQKKYEQALQNFYWAKSMRSNSAYDKGIARMKAELKL